MIWARRGAHLHQPAAPGSKLASTRQNNERETTQVPQDLAARTPKVLRKKTQNRADHKHRWTQHERGSGEEHTCIHRPPWGAHLHLPHRTTIRASNFRPQPLITCLLLSDLTLRLLCTIPLPRFPALGWYLPKHFTLDLLVLHLHLRYPLPLFPASG